MNADNYFYYYFNKCVSQTKRNICTGISTVFLTHQLKYQKTK